MKLSGAEIKTIRDYFSDKPVIRAYVFGSYARGDADDKSDIDLLLQFDYSHKIGLKYISMQLELENLLHRRVDFSSEDFLKPRVKAAIMKERKLVYEKAGSRPSVAG
jgi:predicted nucleotidyltransferase